MPDLHRYLITTSVQIDYGSRESQPFDPGLSEELQLCGDYLLPVMLGGIVASIELYKESHEPRA